MIQAFGPVLVNPEKTRIAFQMRMSFAAVTLKRHGIDGHVVLARRVDSPRFRRIETISPRNQVHSFRLASPDEIDKELLAWLAESYQVGEQRYLSRQNQVSKKRPHAGCQVELSTLSPRANTRKGATLHQTGGEEHG